MCNSVHKQTSQTAVHEEAQPRFSQFAVFWFTRSPRTEPNSLNLECISVKTYFGVPKSAQHRLVKLQNAPILN